VSTSPVSNVSQQILIQETTSRPVADQSNGSNDDVIVIEVSQAAPGPSKEGKPIDLTNDHTVARSLMPVPEP